MIIIEYIAKSIEMIITVSLVEPVSTRREENPHYIVEFFLQVRPVEYKLARFNKTQEFLSVFVIKSTVREVLWDIPGEVNRVFTNKVHSVGMRPNIRVLHAHILLADSFLVDVFISSSSEKDSIVDLGVCLTSTLKNSVRSRDQTNPEQN